MATSCSPAFPGHCQSQLNCSTQQEPQPQPPCSLASQDPSPNRDGKTSFLPPGAEVEVRLVGKGYYGIWCDAIVVEFAVARGRHARAQYSVTFDGEDKMWFASTHVRPRPLALESPPPFRPHNFVEALHERGWWPGLVLSADTKSVTVAFPITREVVTYVSGLVRPRRDYVDGEWVPSRVVLAVAVGPKKKFRSYKVGEFVEVARKRKRIPAKVAKVIDEYSYIVQYSGQNGEEGGASEYLHWQFIRSAVQDRPLKNEFHRRTSAKRQANCKQEHASGKRAKSHAEVSFNGDEHIRDAQYSCPNRSMRAQQKLTLLVQDSENVSVSKTGTATHLSSSEICLTSTCPPNSSSPLYGHSTHREIVVPDNVDKQLKRKEPLLPKVYTLKKSLRNKTEGFKRPHSLHEPLELSSTGQKIGVNEIAGAQRKPLSALERSESTQLEQQQLDSTLENTVNPNEVKYQEPVGVVPLSFASTSDGIGIHGRKFGEGLTAQDNRIISCLLPSAVEAMEALKEFPQQPHFHPLQQYPEAIQKGMQLGLKVAFNDCVGRIRKSSIADNESSFEEKKSTLAELKENGFDVEYVEGLLDRLIEVKDAKKKHLEEKSVVQTQKKQTKSSSDLKELLLGEIDKDIGELEVKLGLLRQKRQLIEQEKEHDKENISRLEVLERNIEKALDDDVQKFNDILAEGQQKHLT